MSENPRVFSKIFLAIGCCKFTIDGAVASKIVAFEMNLSFNSWLKLF